MVDGWHRLTRLTGPAEVVVERVRLADADIAIEGRFELPPLCRLEAEEQTFVVAFIRCEGSIKQMERFFGVSYPTIKNRLKRVASRLEFVEIKAAPAPPAGAADRSEVLDRLRLGEITVGQALDALEA